MDKNTRRRKSHKRPNYYYFSYRDKASEEKTNQNGRKTILKEMMTLSFETLMVDYDADLRIIININNGKKKENYP